MRDRRDPMSIKSIKLQKLSQKEPQKEREDPLLKERGDPLYSEVQEWLQEFQGKRRFGVLCSIH